jgi:hypothetical protein
MGRRAFWTAVVLAMTPGSLALAGLAVSAWQVGDPIVTYWDGPLLTDPVAHQALNGGYNVVQSWGVGEVPIAYSHNLRTMLRDAGVLTPDSLDNGPKQAALNALIDRYKASPAAYAYYIADEPGYSQFARLGALVDYIRRRDPKHVSYINLPYNWSSPSQLGYPDYNGYLD